MFCCFFLLGSKISIAFAAFVKYKQLLQKQKLNKSKIEDSGLKTEIDLAKTAYADHEEHLIRTVIRRNLGILRRKIIVFPFCKASIHWTVTFVMNASQVLEKKMLNGAQIHQHKQRIHHLVHVFTAMIQTNKTEKLLYRLLKESSGSLIFVHHMKNIAKWMMPMQL